jgi:hypothetical protein
MTEQEVNEPIVAALPGGRAPRRHRPRRLECAHRPVAMLPFSQPQTDIGAVAERRRRETAIATP